MASDQSLERPYPRPLSGAAVGQLPSAKIPARTPLCGILEAWLDEDNFDHQGEARTSLFDMMFRRTSSTKGNQDE